MTEIFQNMSPTVVVEEYENEKGQIVTIKEPGEFVVCNLASINLGRAVGKKDFGEILPRLIKIMIRGLDNVIDLNEDKIEVKQAVITNRKYRAIGLGTSGLHQTIALRGIKWESDEAVQFNDELYAFIAFHSIKSSVALAKEKGSYPEFEGSDWQTGEYFRLRGYEDLNWMMLANAVSQFGIRNAYIQAVAPTTSTSVLSNSSAGVDPIFKREYSEEKKDFKIPVTAPDLSPETFWFYKGAYDIDQHWSIKQNAARQRHVDQGISFNLYVRNDIKASELLALHLDAWKSGLKSTYYVRSTAVESNECEVCQ